MEEIAVKMKAAWHSKPSWFVIASNDRMIAQNRNQHRQENGAGALTLPSSHLPMISQPQKVADFIIEAAGSLGEAASAATR